SIGLTPLWSQAEGVRIFFMTKLHIINRRHGFTLIELLVVISIIGFLTTAAVVLLNSARSKARDAKRLADIKQISKAIQMYYDSNNSYPSSGGIGKCLGLASSQTCWTGTVSGSDSLNTALAPYIKIPFDPLYGQRVRGNVYIYADAAANTAWHCIGSSYPKGPFLIWLPDKGGNPSSDSADCGNLGYFSCCGTAVPCAENYHCAYQLQ
ncbi:MAG: type II secretion system protein, partial [bacterium]|nr:type II secretion system protein [bacterium]